MWALFTYGPNGVAENVSESYAYKLGDLASIILKPFNIEEHTRRILGTALVSGLIAKEGVLSTIAIAAGSGEEDASSLTLLNLSVPQAVGFLVFTSLYFPCIATLAAMISVLKSKKLVAAYAVYSILLALLFGYITYLILSIL
jgi:ferrous iron transport protein B